MTTGYVLIVAILILGGVIATVGDRIGLRVGKARLSLFGLRPKQTATVVSILTGSVVSGTTLALLFLVSAPLRKGVFEFEQTQADLFKVRDELEQAQTAKTEAEADLEVSIQRQKEAQRNLQQTNQSLKAVSLQGQKLRTEVKRLQSERVQLQAERQRLIAERDAQIRQKDQEIAQRDAERQRLIAERNTQIRQKDLEIAQRDTAISQRETRLQKLQEQQVFLSEAIAELERGFQGLRQGNVALIRNQPLVIGLVRVETPEAAAQTINQLLNSANSNAIQAILPGSDAVPSLVIRISNTDVENLISRIQDGREYIVQVFSAGNYVVGEPCVLAAEEPCVQVFTDVVVNRLVYESGELLATAPVQSNGLTDERLVERLGWLRTAIQFRARQDGIVRDVIQISDNRPETIVQFLTQVKAYGSSLDIQAVAANEIFTTGPVRVELVATKNGEVLFQTGQQQPPI